MDQPGRSKEQGLDAALLMMSAMPFKLARDVKTFDVDLRMPSASCAKSGRRGHQ